MLTRLGTRGAVVAGAPRCVAPVLRLYCVRTAFALRSHCAAPAILLPAENEHGEPHPSSIRLTATSIHACLARRTRLDHCRDRCGPARSGVRPGGRALGRERGRRPGRLRRRRAIRCPRSRQGRAFGRSPSRRAPRGTGEVERPPHPQPADHPRHRPCRDPTAGQSTLPITTTTSRGRRRHRTGWHRPTSARREVIQRMSEAGASTRRSSNGGSAMSAVISAVGWLAVAFLWLDRFGAISAGGRRCDRSNGHRRPGTGRTFAFSGSRRPGGAARGVPCAEGRRCLLRRHRADRHDTSSRLETDSRWMRVSCGSRHGGDRGSGTVWMLAFIGLIWSLAVMAMTVGGVRAARHRAYAAADLAALAAAAHAIDGPRGACRLAAVIARGSGGRLRRCALRGRVSEVVVTSDVRSVLPLGRLVATGRARAGPQRAPEP